MDEDTGEPNWLTVKTGWFGSNVSFVPIQGAYVGGDDVVVAYGKSTVKEAPNFDADGHISRAEEMRLYEHFNVQRTGRTAADDPAAGTTMGPIGGPEMTR